MPRICVRSTHRRFGPDNAPLEAEIGDEVAALVLDREWALHPLQRRLGILITEVGGALVVGLGGLHVLRSATAGLCKSAHLLECTGMVLRRRLFEQGARAGIIFRAARAL